MVNVVPTEERSVGAPLWSNSHGHHKGELKLVERFFKSSLMKSRSFNQFSVRTDLGEIAENQIGLHHPNNSSLIFTLFLFPEVASQRLY